MILIDEEKAIDCTNCVVSDYCREGIFENCDCIVKNIFDSQPIAYDVDKVIGDLDKYGDTFSDENQDDWWSATVVSNCIDIVKRGGMDA